MEVISELEAAIKQLEDDLFANLNQAQHSACCLGRAHGVCSIWDEQETDVELTEVTNWVVKCGHSPL
jgi:hypothetical protein